MNEEDTWNIAFKTRQGIYKWLVKLGLCNAAITSMHLMNNALHPFLDLFMIVYIDDMLVYNAT